MSALARQQEALLAALFDWPAELAVNALAAHTDGPWARGLQAYQANGHALAQRALQAAYPVLAQLLGSQSFAALARAFWHASPPACGDMAQWGAALADFVAASTQLQDEPYLPDVARLEWALHQSASAADAQGDAASLALLTTHDPAELLLRLSPGCSTQASAWPIVSMVQAHAAEVPDFTAVRQLLQLGVGEEALIWRGGLRAQLRQALPGERAFITALLAGHTLGVALQQASALDIAAWLPLAVQSGLLLGSHPASASPTDLAPP